jgi:hypothetical protein
MWWLPRLRMETCDPRRRLIFLLFFSAFRYLVTQGCIKPLCDLLTCPDPRIVTVSLEGLENILKVGEQEKDLGNSCSLNLYARYIDEAEGLEKIENLQTHDNNEIYEKAVKILETYWLEEDEDQNLAPGVEGQKLCFRCESSYSTSRWWLYLRLKGTTNIFLVPFGF